MNGNHYCLISGLQIVLVKSHFVGKSNLLNIAEVPVDS